MSKKVNPRRKPCTQAQANRKADNAFYLAIALMMSTVAETDRFSDSEIVELWDKINYKADSVSKGYVKLSDICQSLYDEYGIEVSGVKINR